MKRRASLLLVFFVAFHLVAGAAFAPPLLVCGLTGRATLIPSFDTPKAPDDCCAVQTVYRGGQVAGHALRTASCCRLTPGLERIAPAVTADHPAIALPPAVASAAPPLPPGLPDALPSFLAADTIAPCGPPLRATPSRAPPSVS